VKSDNWENRTAFDLLRLKIQLFLIIYRWASLSFALILLLAQGNILWVIYPVVIYNVLVTAYLKLYSKGRFGSTRFHLLDLAICIFLVILGGSAVADPVLNPFFLYSFAPLLAIGLNHAMRDSILAAILLSLSYFFVPVNSPDESFMATEFVDTHIANLLSFFFVAVVISQVGGALRRHVLAWETLSAQEIENSSPCDDIDMLSPREQEIFFLLCGGKSNNEIADKLFISENTVKNHTTSIYRKLEVGGKAELLRLRLKGD